MFLYLAKNDSTIVLKKQQAFHTVRPVHVGQKWKKLKRNSAEKSAFFLEKPAKY